MTDAPAQTQIPITAVRVEKSATNRTSGYGCDCGVRWDAPLRVTDLSTRKVCGARWDGLKTCHCTACHRTFTTVTAFDKHRRGTYDPDKRHCIDPASIGLVDAGRSYPCWGKPATDSPWQTDPNE